MNCKLMKQLCSNKIAKNAAWLIAVKIVQSLLGVLISMISARYLGPSNYGIINYAASITAFAVPIMQLGINNVLVQELVHASEDEGTLLGSAMVMSLLSSLLCIIGVGAFSMITNAREKETIVVCILYSLSVFFQVFEILNYWFQANFLSKYTALISFFAYVIVSVYKILLLVNAKDIFWFAISNSIDFAIISIAQFIIYRRMGGKKLSFNLGIARRLLYKGKYYILPDLMIVVFAQTDRIMLKKMLGAEFTGYYSVAVVCAGLTSFVFAAIINSYRPAIFEAHLQSEKYFEERLITLYKIIVILSLAQSVVMSAGAKVIISILYGKMYLQAVPALRIVVWYTTFSYLGCASGIWLLANKCQQYLLIVNMSGALINVLLNMLLIPMWGIEGAAIASLVTQITTNLVVGMLIKPIRRGNLLILKAFDPRRYHLPKRRRD